MNVRIFAILCAVFWMCALPLAFVELRPFVSGGQTREARFEMVADGKEKPGISSYSQRLALDNCLEAVNSIYGRTRPPQRRADSLGACRKLSAKIVSVNPANAYAWYIGALSAVGAGDIAAFNAQLMRSRLTGPNEQWIAELRVGLAELRFAELDAINHDGHEADLKLMAESFRGAQSIARRYISDAEFKVRIIALVEMLPEKTQARFVRNVRQAAREMGLIS